MTELIRSPILDMGPIGRSASTAISGPKENTAETIDVKRLASCEETDSKRLIFPLRKNASPIRFPHTAEQTAT